MAISDHMSDVIDLVCLGTLMSKPGKTYLRDEVGTIEQERDAANAEVLRLTTALEAARAGCISTYAPCRRALDPIPVRPASSDDYSSEDYTRELTERYAEEAVEGSDGP